MIVSENPRTVIVPSFNEAATLPRLLGQLRDALPQAQIIVVDDGSTDETDDHSVQWSDRFDVHWLRHPGNLGKGAAVRTGLAVASGRWVAIQDADLEYNPAELAQLFDRAETETASAGRPVAVYGSRYLTGGRAKGGSPLAYWAVRVLALWQWLLFGRWLSDPLTCYKVLPTSWLRSIDLQSRRFELCAEMNARLIADGVPIKEVPVSYRPRGYDEGKKIGAADFFASLAMYARCRSQTWFKRSGEAVDKVAISSARRWTYLLTRLAIGAVAAGRGSEQAVGIGGDANGIMVDHSLIGGDRLGRVGADSRGGGFEFDSRPPFGDRDGRNLCLFLGCVGVAVGRWGNDLRLPGRRRDGNWLDGDD